LFVAVPVVSVVFDKNIFAKFLTNKKLSKDGGTFLWLISGGIGAAVMRAASASR
jgi:hypothetical protein